MGAHTLRRLTIVAFVAHAVGCAAPSRFALRPPVLREGDDRPFARKVTTDEESEYANTVDAVVLRTLSNAVRFDTCGPSHNVNSLDEVPDSTWFTNRSVTPAELLRGTCPSDGPTPPLKIKTTKEEGPAQEFDAVDAHGVRFTLRTDGLRPRQPEITTAANAIVSRLYWAAGYNTPCTNVAYLHENDLTVTDKSEEIDEAGSREQLSSERLSELLAKATRRLNGDIRLSAMRSIAGESVGAWRGKGKRKDDPNDMVEHEDRRELRAERLLAAWVNHWDTQGNSYDAFVPAPAGGGYIVHYFLDFADSLGGTATGKGQGEPRLGYTSVFNPGEIAVDAVTFGLVRRPWDKLKVDSRYPNLGLLSVEHFAPMDYSPLIPLVRWSCAQQDDLAWMARRIAQIGRKHIQVAVDAGDLANSKEAIRLVDILVGRREKILRASFSRVSPLANVTLTQRQLCMSDLGVVAGTSLPQAVSYASSFQRASGDRSSATLRHEVFAERAQVCIDLPPHFARAASLDGSVDRYGTIDIVRIDGKTKTTLRAHVYDLGQARGYVLAGVERL